MIRHRRSRSCSRSYDSVSPRHHSRSPSRSRGKKKKSHKKRKHSSTSSSSSRRSSFSSSRERERKRHKSKKKKKKHSKSRSSKRDMREKKHKRKRSPSQSEDNQDLAPDTEIQNVSEIQSDVSTDDMRFLNLVEEVFKLLLADMFPKKTDEFLGGNRPRSSIELEMRKATKKSISLPQSRRPLIKAVDCLNESLGASEVDGSFPMPPTITQDWVPSRADIRKLVKLKYYQFVPTATASVLDPDSPGYVSHGFLSC